VDTTNVRNVVVTCEIKLFQNHFSLRRLLIEIISFRRVETCPKWFQNYFTGLLQLTNISNVFSVAEIILE